VRRGPPYWFPAKRYGWGWGLPLTWQGWVVLVVYLVAVPVGYLLFPPHQQTVGFLIYVNAITLIFVFVCWLTGEPPRWRWGK
jgi:hypothetical protein